MCTREHAHVHTHTPPSYILFHKPIAVSATLEATSTQDFLKLPDPMPGVPGSLPHSRCYCRYLLSRGRISGWEPLLTDSLLSGLQSSSSQGSEPDSSYLSTMQRPVVCTSRGRTLGGDGVILMGGGGSLLSKGQGGGVALCLVGTQEICTNPSIWKMGVWGRERVPGIVCS